MYNMGEPFMENKRIVAFDGLKGLCCLPIILVHYAAMSSSAWGIDYGMLPFAKVLSPLYGYGWTFIYPFFGLSGFLVAKKYKDLLRTSSLYTFLRHRLKSLYPAVFMSITIGIVLSFIDGMFLGQIITTKLNAWNIFMNYSLMHFGWAEDLEVTAYGSGTWFVCVLLLCYIYYYFVAHYFRRYYLHLIHVLFFLGWATSGVEIPFIKSQGGYCAFFGGVVLYEYIYGELKDIVHCSVNNRVLKSVLSFFFMLILAAICVTGGFTPDMMMVIIPPILIYYAINVEWFSALLRFKPIQMMGKISMSVYLSHMAAQRMIVILLTALGFSDTFTSSTVFCLTMAWSFAFAIAFYFFVEKFFTPCFVRLMKRILR